MKLLITGSDGQVGQSLRRLLKTQSVTLLALSKEDLDITQEKNVHRTIKLFKPNYIINAAAYTNVEQAEQQPEIAMNINGDAPGFLAQAAAIYQATLLHLSTDYLFDGQQNIPYIENTKPNPLNSYGKSKLAGEIAIQNNCPHHIILRTSWVFSEYKNNFVKTILSLLKNKDRLNIINDQYASPTYAGNIATTLLDIIKKLQQTQKSLWGTYHYSGAPYVNWYEFAQVIVQQALSQNLINKNINLCPISSNDYNSKVIRPLCSKLDCQKIKNTFDINPSNWQQPLTQLKPFLPI